MNQPIHSFDKKGYPKIKLFENHFELKAIDFWEFRSFNYSDVEYIKHYNPNELWYNKWYVYKSLLNQMFAKDDPWILKIKLKNGGDWTYKTSHKTDDLFLETLIHLSEKVSVQNMDFISTIHGHATYSNHPEVLNKSYTKLYIQLDDKFIFEKALVDLRIKFYSNTDEQPDLYGGIRYFLLDDDMPRINEIITELGINANLETSSQHNFESYRSFLINLVLITIFMMGSLVLFGLLKDLL